MEELYDEATRIFVHELIAVIAGVVYYSLRIGPLLLVLAAADRSAASRSV